MTPEPRFEGRPSRSRAGGISLGVDAPSEGVPRVAPATAPVGRPRPPAMVDLTDMSPEGSRESSPSGDLHRDGAGARNNGRTGSGGMGSGGTASGGTDGGAAGSAGPLSGGTRSDGDDTRTGGPDVDVVQRRLKFTLGKATEGTGRASWDHVRHGLMQVDVSFNEVEGRHKQPAGRAATVASGRATAVAYAAPVSLCSSLSDSGGCRASSGQSDGGQSDDEFRSPQLLHDRGEEVPPASVATTPVSSQGRVVGEPAEDVIDLT